MSQLHSNNPNREFKSLQKSYQNWDAGTPSPDLWEDLEADLAVSAVWDRLDETLELNGSSADKELVDSYENWSPNTSGDGWTKLEEQLSRERVWNRLNVSLSYPVTTRIPWVKMAAASVLFIFLSFYTDHVVESGNDQSRMIAGIATGDQHSSDAVTDRQLAFNNHNEHAVSAERKVAEANIPQGNKAIQVQKVRNNFTNPIGNKTNATNTNPVREQNGSIQLNQQDVAVNPKNGTVNSNAAHPEDNQNPASTTNPDASNTASTLNDLAGLDELGIKEIAFEPTNEKIGDFVLIPLKTPFKPRFSVQFGGQFSLINEKNRSAFSSSLPSMGIAADLQYHYYIGNIRLTQDLGFSQYAQSNGSYINGRYVSSDQRLNTIFLMSSAGYTYRGATLYGGVSINRLLGGYEANRSMITNVYNSNKFQLGATAGIDYHIAPFKNKTALGVGMQYQFVSRLKSGNAVFSDIQGVKLQIKYSF